MNTIDWMNWLAATMDGLDLLTVQYNLVIIFDPLDIVPYISKTTLRKVLRWAVRLTA